MALDPTWWATIHSRKNPSIRLASTLAITTPVDCASRRPRDRLAVVPILDDVSRLGASCLGSQFRRAGAGLASAAMARRSVQARTQSGRGKRYLHVLHRAIGGPPLACSASVRRERR